MKMNRINPEIIRPIKRAGVRNLFRFDTPSFTTLLFSYYRFTNISIFDFPSLPLKTINVFLLPYSVDSAIFSIITSKLLVSIESFRMTCDDLTV